MLCCADIHNHGFFHCKNFYGVIRTASLPWDTDVQAPLAAASACPPSELVLRFLSLPVLPDECCTLGYFPLSESD